MGGAQAPTHPLLRRRSRGVATSCGGIAGEFMRRSNKRGAAAVEFALVAMLLITLLLGIVEFSFVFFRMGSFASAAREGARYYAIHHTDADAVDRAIDAAVAAAPALTAADVDVVETCPPTFPAAPPYPNAKVVVEATYSPGITGLFGWIFTPGFKLSGEGVMRCGG